MRVSSEDALRLARRLVDLDCAAAELRALPTALTPARVVRAPAGAMRIGDLMNQWVLLGEIAVGWFLGSWIAWRIVNGYWKFWE